MILIQFKIKYLNVILNWYVLNEIYYFNFNKTALHFAVEKGNVEIVQLLLAFDNLDVNLLSIINHYL